MNQNHAPLYFTSNVTSIHGGRLGLSEKNTIVGPIGLQRGINAIDSTEVSTGVPSHGVNLISNLDSTDGPIQHTLDAPIPGIAVTFQMACTSTGSVQFGSTANGASIIATSLGTTVGWLNMTGPGGFATLVGVSTAQFAVIGKSTAVTWTTST